MATIKFTLCTYTRESVESSGRLPLDERTSTSKEEGRRNKLTSLRKDQTHPHSPTHERLCHLQYSKVVVWKVYSKKGRIPVILTSSWMVVLRSRVSCTRTISTGFPVENALDDGKKKV
ncbi:hypothetical protein Cob_v001185 [Colletotrichum orbiculare MAFF 240422]|uniref:Uncharacterized protein n=1 Tax=Colletotrichum orbiculare (strain 104-T / ATCC 96160 / CBS 514.97 / LARS 414 / MAFF 240422) TaxID=1213857 RepID=A0A484G8J3_COLOR|nr:hypothetical protein Cob_v001185 [Colletotrichum orbiculare MAFF 240422]